MALDSSVNGGILMFITNKVIPKAKIPSLKASIRPVPSRFFMIFLVIFAMLIMSFCWPQAIRKFAF